MIVKHLAKLVVTRSKIIASNYNHIKMYHLTMEKLLPHKPSLEELQGVLQKGLEGNFASVEVSVVPCPNLTKEPFNLLSPGLRGSPSILDVGGVPYLAPIPFKDKLYDLNKLSRLIGRPASYMMGAGAGPFPFVGCNCELIANVRTSSQDKPGVNGSYIVKVDPQDGSYIQEKLATSEFALMANLLVCDGKPGNVLQVKVSQRTGPQCFPEAIRLTLKSHYEKKVVSLGGTFAVLKGSAKIHVMPEFSEEPLVDESAVNNWLKYYTMDAPLICVGTLVSHDPGLSLRVEHFHCYSPHGQGGHYHYDTTPEEVEYLGYFVPGEMLYRIDQPSSNGQNK